MLRLSRLSFLTVAVAGALAVSACTPRVTTTGGQTPPTGSSTPTQGQVDVTQPVTVALLAPMSGSRAADLGKALGNAARMAASDAGDPLLKLRIYDTGGNAGKARAAAEQAVRDGAKLIAGPLFGANTKAIASVAASNGIKVLSFSTDTTVAGGPVYLSGFLPETAARRITSFARSRGYNAIGVFYPETGYGNAANRGVSQGARGSVVTSKSYPRTSEGIPPAAKQFAADARAAGANAVVLAESGQALQYVGAVLRGQGLGGSGVKFLGLGEWNSRATLGEASLRGGWFAAPDPAAMKAFVTKYQRSHGSVPPPLAVLGYDAIKIAARMLSDARASRSTDPFSVQSLTRGQGFQGAVGPLRFGPDGLGERAMAILEVGQGVFTTIDPAPRALGLGS